MARHNVATLRTYVTSRATLEREILFPNVPNSEKEPERRDSEIIGVPAI
jgi:hypothetical protein